MLKHFSRLAPFCLGLLWCLLLPVLAASATRAQPARYPRNNPAAIYHLAWTKQLRWRNLRNVQDFPGATALERFKAAQAAVVATGGGVVFFPAGTYYFDDSLELKSGVVLRGADPTRSRYARDQPYAPPSRFEFPKHGFKIISNAENARNIGIVNLDINRARLALKLPQAENCLVYGNRLTNAIGLDPQVPQAWQQPEQRWTDRHSRAIGVFALGNVLVANNRIARSSDHFRQPGYVLAARGQPAGTPETRTVLFDYDNRYGIRVNRETTQRTPATPESDPHLFRPGIVVADNYVFVSGRVGIHVGGNGAQILRNFIQGERAVRNTVNGIQLARGSDTNEHRAIDIAGWNYRIEDNEFYDFRNQLENSRYPLTDGEGILQQESSGSEARGGLIRNNRGNAYIGIYKIGVASGITIAHNRLSGDADILLTADRNNGPGLAQNNRIIGNQLEGNIVLTGSQTNSLGNQVSGNLHTRGLGKIKLGGRPVHSHHRNGSTVVRDNQGFSLEETE